MKVLSVVIMSTVLSACSSMAVFDTGPEARAAGNRCESMRSYRPYYPNECGELSGFIPYGPGYMTQ